jgi:hypothetical protein
MPKNLPILVPRCPPSVSLVTFISNYYLAYSTLLLSLLATSTHVPFPVHTTNPPSLNGSGDPPFPLFGVPWPAGLAFSADYSIAPHTQIASEQTCLGKTKNIPPNLKPRVGHIIEFFFRSAVAGSLTPGNHRTVRNGRLPAPVASHNLLPLAHWKLIFPLRLVRIPLSSYYHAYHRPSSSPCYA